MALPRSARAWSAARRFRFSCMKPRGSPSSGVKSSRPGFRPSATVMLQMGQPGSASSCATSIVSSIRCELEDTALVRPSNERSFRCAGSAGSMTIADKPLASRAEASASPTKPPPRMITSAWSICEHYPLRRIDATTSLDRGVYVEDSRAQLGEGTIMATVATRAPKRELAPDWRDAVNEALRRLAVRSAGALLIGVSLAGAIALATHNSNDPSLNTAAGGPPTNWLGSFGAFLSDALLLLFGLGSALFLPVIALAGLRLVRLERAGRVGRSLLLAACGAILLGVALGLTSGSAVSGLPAGWGGALGLAGAHGVGAAVGLI